MIEAIFNQPNYVGAKKLLDATVLRHEALASNLANVETPGYKRIDVAKSFQTELNQAMNARDPGQIGALQPMVQEDMTAKAQTRDGNTVQVENEMAELQKNYLAHSVETQWISGSLLRLRLAITGRG